MKYFKCVKCGKQARWKSPIYTSPLCEDCVIEEAKKVSGLDNPEIDDYFLQICLEVENTEIKPVTFKRK